MNIVFIGMPGSGKTTVSRIVAERLKRAWYDSDALIASSEHMSISDIFVKYGEEYFRERETEQLQKLSELDGAVISAGGGAVLRNGALLRRNAVVVYLERSLENIARTLEPGTRPLVDDTSRLRRLYEERSGLYETLCDFKIDNNKSIAEVVEKVLEVVT